MRRSLLLLAALMTTFAGAGSAAAQTTALGDTLFSFNAGQVTPTQDTGLTGIEFAEGHFWITGFNPPVYDHRLYKISADGSEVVQSTSLATGYHAYYDLAYDGDFLYASDRDHLAQIDPATGQLTGEQIPANFYPYLVQGVAYDPATDHFWVMPQRNGQLQVLHEIDRDGTILRTFPNLDTDYTAALTWDTWSPGGPFLWTFSREEVGRDSRSVLRQFSPGLGAFTGVEIEIVNRSEIVRDGPLGAVLTDGLDPETVTMATLQSGALEVSDGLDWVVVYDADLQDAPPLSPQITVDPPTIEAEVVEDSTVQIPVVIGNAGNLGLNWNAYVENPDAASGGDGELGDVLASIDVAAAIDTNAVSFNSMTFARDHLWVAGRILPDEPRLFKIDLDGTLVDSYPVGTLNNLGWRSIASDGDFIYGTDTYSIAVWSIDSTAVADNVFTGSIGGTSLAYDPDNEHFYLGSGTGAIKVIDREGDEVRLVVTPFDIEGLAWDDHSPGGPFLWAWTDAESEAGSRAEAVQLDPVSGVPTGVRFRGTDQGAQPNVPEAATITRDVVPGTLTFLGLQESDDYQNYEAFVVAYDLDVALPPAWIDLRGPTVSSVDPEGSDTLMVAIHGTMADTTTSAVLRIESNDLSQPLVEIPVTTIMRAASPVSAADDPGATPELFVLRQNYPNPFGPSTRIQVELREAAEVSLEIFDVQGRRVAVMERAQRGPGQHAFVWDGADSSGRSVASGVYLYTLTVGEASETRKMLLMR